MQPTQDKEVTSTEVTLCVAFELYRSNWTLALQDGKRDRPAITSVSAGGANARLDQALAVIETTRRNWGLSADTPVVVVHELGEDGYWIARALQQRGIDVKVVDAVSRPVRQQARHGKTKRIDAIRLVNALRAWLRGEHDVMHVVAVPTEEEEMQQHLVEMRGDLREDIAGHQDFIRELLNIFGCQDEPGDGFVHRLAQGQVRGVGGVALPAEVQACLVDECEQLALAQQQLHELETKLLANVFLPNI
nr:hypothetical protein [uncultured Noviherbaspirillum sp.]